MTYTLSRRIYDRAGEVSNVKRIRQRKTLLFSFSEDEGNKRMDTARRAISRVLAEWSEESARAKPIPPSVDLVVRAHCADYERRARAIAENEREREALRAQREAEKTADEAHDASLIDDGFPPRRFDDSRLTNRRMRAFRFKGRCALPASLVNRYRLFNALIDLAIDEVCEAGLRDTMRRDIAERRGDRRTTLYFVDRRVYLRVKRKTKLAIAAALGLL